MEHYQPYIAELGDRGLFTALRARVQRRAIFLCSSLGFSSPQTEQRTGSSSRSATNCRCFGPDDHILGPRPELVISSKHQMFSYPALISEKGKGPVPEVQLGVKPSHINFLSLKDNF